MAKKKIKMHSAPVGEMTMGFIQRPSKEYSDDEHGEYAIKVAFDGTEEGFAEFKEKCDAIDAKAWKMAADEELEGRIPSTWEKISILKKELNDQDEPTGRWMISMTQPASWPSGDFRSLPLFQANGQAFPPSVKIGKGSRVSVSFSFGQPYASKGQKKIGIKPYLQAVMVTDLVEYNSQPSADKFGFSVNSDAEALEVDAPGPDAPFDTDADSEGDVDDVDF